MKQCAIVEGVSTDVVPVTFGVFAAPLLFLVFINDLPESISLCVKLFPDDCLAYGTIHSPNDAIQLQGDFDPLGLWVKAWQVI